MTLHLQTSNKWIITEIELRALMGYLHDTHKYRGHEIGCRVRSHPAPTEQEILDKVLEELFVWVDSEQTISITADKIIKKILSLRTPTPEAYR